MKCFCLCWLKLASVDVPKWSQWGFWYAQRLNYSKCLWLFFIQHHLCMAMKTKLLKTSWLTQFRFKTWVKHALNKDILAFNATHKTHNSGYSLIHSKLEELNSEKCTEQGITLQNNDWNWLKTAENTADSWQGSKGSNQIFKTKMTQSKKMEIGQLPMHSEFPVYHQANYQGNFLLIWCSFQISFK